MPLTGLQAEIAKLLAANRTPDNHLAGGAALHFEPQSLRYSNDLDYFQDSEQRVATASSEDVQLLKNRGFSVEIELTQPGYVRAQVRRGPDSTKVEWAHDSAWRFMPPIAREECGYQLHPIDLAINKALTLAGRDEPRDFLDIMFINREILPLGALVWAAAGKDPGFTPLSLLELLRRRGKYRPEDFKRLKLNGEIDLQDLKREWLAALENAEAFIRSRPAAEIGCLYYSPRVGKFVAPDSDTPDARPHYGRPGGVLPKIEGDDASIRSCAAEGS